MIPPGGIDASVWGGLIGTAVAFILACALTFFAGLPRKAIEPMAVVKAGENDVLSPMSGTVLALDQVPDSTFASGLPNTGSYDMAFRLVADASAQSPARVVMAIGDATRPGPSLASCSADPEAVGCAEHVLDLSPWLFCDGFEHLPHICGQPQGF